MSSNQYPPFRIFNRYQPAFAPDGKEVEELSGKEILASLRKKIPAKEFSPSSRVSESRDEKVSEKKEVKEVKEAVSSGFKKIRKDVKRREEPGKVLKDISKVEEDIKEEIKDVEK